MGKKDSQCKDKRLKKVLYTRSIDQQVLPMIFLSFSINLIT